MSFSSRFASVVKTWVPRAPMVLGRLPASGAPVALRRFSVQAETEGARVPRSMEDTVSEQRQVLFPNAQKLEEAWQQKDAARQAASKAEDWSPRQLPYKTYEKDGSLDDSDEEVEVEEDGLEVGVEEVSDDVPNGDDRKWQVTDF
ncbi:unnamed protein product [Durusdinium trenchii]|uniref:Succinate dehydrogenase assembly factor 4, mitochondrial n=1 Tax=Durusdinium trenchii TaxID=1381693 RepID=A0ABP0PLC4_9DINO